MKQFYQTIVNDPGLLIALIALFTSIASILIGIFGLIIQRSHNKKSVKPFGSINLIDYEDRLQIIISNTGLGPMIIKSCKTKLNGETRQFPVDWMPAGIAWRTFQKIFDDHAISAGEQLILLELETDLKNPEQIERRDKVRLILKDLEMTLFFVDVYGKKYSESKTMTWFGRNYKETLHPTNAIANSGMRVR